MAWAYGEKETREARRGSLAGSERGGWLSKTSLQKRVRMATKPLGSYTVETAIRVLQAEACVLHHVLTSVKTLKRPGRG